MPILTNFTCFRQYRVDRFSNTFGNNKRTVQKLKHLCVPELVHFLDCKENYTETNADRTNFCQFKARALAEEEKKKKKRKKKKKKERKER